MKRPQRVLVLTFAVVALAAGSTLVAAEKKAPIERWSATTLNWLGQGKVGVTEIKIYEWSSAEDREALIEAFSEGGSDRLVDLLGQSTEKGVLRTPDSRTYKMTYAFQFEEGDRRLIVMATDRPMSPRASLDSEEYNVSIVLIELDKAKNKGTGQMIVAGRIGIDEATGRLEITSASSEPIRFTSVRGPKQKKKK